MLPHSLSSSTPHALQRQSDLVASVRRLFQNEPNIQENVRREAKIRDGESGMPLELDIWLPDLHLAFEFQDPYHYVTTWYSNTSVGDVRVKDIKKSEGAQKRSETLIVVPCWWDGRDESLIATIREQRPDLLSSSSSISSSSSSPSSPIPLSPPNLYFNATAVPGVGELMIPSFPKSVYFDPTNWWISEKYDGVRACWNPKTKSLYSRRGGLLPLFSPSITKCLPGAFIDGEIWMGRGTFQELQGIYGDEPFAWQFLRMIGLDWSDVLGHRVPFEERFDLLLASTPSSHPFVICQGVMLCKRGKQDIKKITKEIMERGGEGVVVRKNRSVYVSGRTEELIKYKAMRQDQEGFVIGVEPHEYLIKLPSGVVFQVAKSPQEARNRDRKEEEKEINEGEVEREERFDEEIGLESEREEQEIEKGEKRDKREEIEETEKIEREDIEGREKRDKREEIQIGDVVTFTYTSVTSSGKPVNARELRVRRDVKWEQVVEDYKKDIPRPLSENTVTHSSLSHPVRHPHGHWTIYEGENLRNFFENFASKIGIDPLVPENWYPITLQRILQEKHGNTVISHFNNSLKRALISIYPDIGLDESKFSTVTRGYWNSVENKKKFFLLFARKRGFNPLLSTNWHNIKQEDITQEKGGITVLDKYGRSLPRALISLFPHFSKDSWFRSSLRTRTYNMKERIEFFDKIAKEKEFDPLISDHWLSLNSDFVSSHKVGKAILDMFDGSLIRALKNTYSDFDAPRKIPNIEAPRTVPQPNPLKLLSKNNSPKKEKATTHVLSSVDEGEYWKVVENRKQFFDEFSKKRKFDPLIPRNWYTISVNDIIAEKGVVEVMGYYNFSLPSALSHLYPNIDLQESLFSASSRRSWSISVRKTILDHFAHSLGFTPSSSPSSWKSISKDQLRNHKVMSNMLNYCYRGSLTSALSHIYPRN